MVICSANEARIEGVKVMGPEAREDVFALSVDATKSADFCRDWRHRRIAHRDLHLALNAGAEPLKPVSREKI